MIGSVSVANPTVMEGERNTLNVTIQNTGNAASTASTVGIYQSSDATISAADTLIATMAVPALRVGASRSVRARLIMPATAGTYYYGAIADYNNAISESDYTDNTSGAAQVDVTPAPKPNLVVGAANINNPAGATSTMTIAVQNVGNLKSGASKVGIYESSDATITAADTLLSTASVRGVDRRRLAQRQRDADFADGAWNLLFRRHRQLQQYDQRERLYRQCVKRDATHRRHQRRR